MRALLTNGRGRERFCESVCEMNGKRREGGWEEDSGTTGILSTFVYWGGWDNMVASCRVR